MDGKKSQSDSQGNDVCPVCLKPIEASDPVAIDHGEVIHADCLGKPPTRRASRRHS